MPRVITVASQKGGVGKTTTVVNLAHGLALRGKETLIVDLDPQGQSAIALGISQEPGVFNSFVGELALNQVLRATSRARLWIVPGDKRTATAQTVLVAEGEDILSAVKSQFVKPFNGRPDYVIFDTAPSVGGFQEGAIAAADLVIIPAATDHLALFGVTGVIQTITALCSKRKWAGAIMALPTFYDQVTKQSQENLESLKGSLGDLRNITVLDPVHRATALREATANGETIFEHDGKSRAAEEYAALVWHVMGAFNG